MNLSSVQAPSTIFLQDINLLYPKHGIGISNLALQLYKNAKTIDENLAQHIEKGLTYIEKEYLPKWNTMKTPEEKYGWIFDLLTNVGQYLDEKKPLQWRSTGILIVLEPCHLSSEQSQKYADTLAAIPIKTDEVVAKSAMANSSSSA